MPRTDEPQTPLLALLRECDSFDREYLAVQASTTVPYLYQLASGQRTPSVVLAAALIAASESLNQITKGRTRVLTLEMFIPKE